MYAKRLATQLQCRSLRAVGSGYEVGTWASNGLFDAQAFTFADLIAHMAIRLRRLGGRSDPTGVLAPGGMADPPRTGIRSPQVVALKPGGSRSPAAKDARLR